MGELVQAGRLQLWIERRGTGPDVLLISGLGDPLEAWQLQLEGLSDRYRLTAFDNRGVGRSPMPNQSFTVADLADDAAALLESLDVPRAHVVGHSGGSLVAQELALRHPDLVRSIVLVSTWARLDPYSRRMAAGWRWQMETAPSERAFLESFFLWFYTRRAHEEGTVDYLIEEALEFPHKQSAESLQHYMDAFQAHDTTDRLADITLPTLVLAGGADIAIPPFHSRTVAEAIPGARFEVLADQAHQPFQEAPDEFNQRVDDFWGEIDARP